MEYETIEAGTDVGAGPPPDARSFAAGGKHIALARTQAGSAPYELGENV